MNLTQTPTFVSRAFCCRHPELMVVNAPGAGGTPDAAKVSALLVQISNVAILIPIIERVAAHSNLALIRPL